MTITLHNTATIARLARLSCESGLTADRIVDLTLDHCLELGLLERTLAAEHPEQWAGLSADPELLTSDTARARR